MEPTILCTGVVTEGSTSVPQRKKAQPRECHQIHLGVLTLTYGAGRKTDTLNTHRIFSNPLLPQIVRYSVASPPFPSLTPSFLPFSSPFNFPLLPVFLSRFIFPPFHPPFNYITSLHPLSYYQKTKIHPPTDIFV